ncbi:unnamed protein product [Strongylus vulgaris]|uniref:Peptidase A1 domain-containing protein n=1 Tax=Strongylus vulgaris TaxID=40348 RepID=A0A3P7JCA2_STRVU|nr:unnamed protein product [Strongylus vulgaris]
MEYVAKITIGTPPQTLRVALDTGLADTWVVDYTCAANKPVACDISVCDEGLLVDTR